MLRAVQSIGQVGFRYHSSDKRFCERLQANSLDSNCERVAFTIFFGGLDINNERKITTTRKCSGKCMKPEPSEVKTDQSIKTYFNFKSQQLSNKWRRLYKKIVA